MTKNELLIVISRALFGDPLRACQRQFRVIKMRKGTQAVRNMIIGAYSCINAMNAAPTTAMERPTQKTRDFFAQARHQLKQAVEIANQRHPKYSGSRKSDLPSAASEANYREQGVLKSFRSANC